MTVHSTFQRPRGAPPNLSPPPPSGSSTTAARLSRLRRRADQGRGFQSSWSDFGFQTPLYNHVLRLNTNERITALTFFAESVQIKLVMPLAARVTSIFI